MIYIVEDDQSISDSFLVLLRSAGYECDCFETAENFLKCYNTGSQDLLILDMQLSGMNGCKLLETLAERGLHLPVIVITSLDKPKYRQCSRDHGAIAYLRKPIDGTALIDVIRHKLDISIPTNNSISS